MNERLIGQGPPKQPQVFQIQIMEIIQFRAALGSATVQSDKLKTTLELFDEIILNFAKELSPNKPNKDN